MKKFLITSFMLTGLVGMDAHSTAPAYTEVNASPFKMEKAGQASDASLVHYDQRKVNAMVQKTAHYARRGVIAVLLAAENEGYTVNLSNTGYNTAVGATNLRKVAETSFIGLANLGGTSGSLKVDASGAIQFTLDPSEVDEGIGIGKYTVTYYPVLVDSGSEGSFPATEDKYIDGWSCVTTASTETRLGRGHITHSQDTIEPMFQGLGFPFELCTIVNQTPSIDDIAAD